MPRPNRKNLAHIAYHVMNRAVAGLTIFESDADYDAFEQVLAQARERFPAMRVCAYCVMPNHFHLVLFPTEDGLLSSFMQWLTMTHTQRWHANRHSAGRGHLYQGRFKSFPIEQDNHFLRVCRYVERNAVRANLAWSPDGEAMRAQYWRWGSVAARADAKRRKLLCDPWPVEMPRNWVATVNRAESPAELEAIRKCIARGNPFGDGSWCAATIAELGLESTTKPRGRPKKV